jgi:hypothetical protein
MDFDCLRVMDVYIRIYVFQPVEKKRLVPSRQGVL